MPEDPGRTPRKRAPPSQIGPYKILRTLGEGGMGVVYEAEQSEPLKRRVALKVVRTGYDTRQILARFEAERQALAVMDHPNIARVYDAGTTDDGLPYFAMELVKGTPITEYCDTQTLTTEERLRLFALVCRAVQHAHHKGVIHRDLKPSNVLVTIADNEAVPKVIDFGVAKAIGQGLTDRTLITRHGQIIGTPEYMSPEQAEMTGLDIDTRTDIYSLGVILYELLVGARPLNLGNVALVALWNAIRERTPPTPSARLSTLPGVTQERIAHHRQTGPAELRRTLRGDLDWVAMKCLEKDRTRRYETANGLAVDIERFLRHEPVVARPPSASYRFRKFVRRHRAGVAAGIVTVLAVSTGAAAATMGMVRAQRAEERAVAEASAAQEVADFLVSLFEVSDPSEARGTTITAREVLDQGAERIRTELENQPRTRARLMHTIGSVYHALGLYEEAARYLSETIAFQEDEFGPDHPTVAETYMRLGMAYREGGDYEAAKEAHERALSIRQNTLGPDHLQVAQSLSDLGVVYWSQGRFEEAVESLQEALARRERALAPGDSLIAVTANNLATVYTSQGRYDEAEPLWRRAMEIYERVKGPDHPNFLRLLNNLGTLYLRTGDHLEAERLMRRGLDIRERVLGPDHPDVGFSYSALGGLYYRMKEYGRADSMLSRALDIRLAAHGPMHTDVGASYMMLGNVRRSLEQYDQAEPLFRRSLEIFETQLGSEHPYVGYSRYGLSIVHGGRDELAAAEREGRRALEIWRSGLGLDHPDVALAMENLADVEVRLGRIQDAEQRYRETIAYRERVLGPEHEDLAGTMEKLAELLRSRDRGAEADSLEAVARRIREAGAGDDDPSRANRG